MTFESLLRIMCEHDREVLVAELVADDFVIGTVHVGWRPGPNSSERVFDTWQPNAATRAAVGEESLPLLPRNPDSPRHFQWNLACDRPTCNYSQALGEESIHALRSLVHAMWHRHLPLATTAHVAGLVHCLSLVTPDQILDRSDAERRGLLEVYPVDTTL